MEVKAHIKKLKSILNEHNIDYYVIDPQKSKLIKKSYIDNFLKKN